MHWVSYRSNKTDKRIANRRMRRNNRVLIKLGKTPYNKLKELCDIWNFDSDGKAYYMSYNLQNRLAAHQYIPCSIYSDSPWCDEDIIKINMK